MKRFFSLILSTALVVTSLTACKSDNKAVSTESPSGSSKLSVVTTIFPEYDWTKQILGSHSDEAELTMLLDNGVDLHSYQPTVDDISKISKCDVFIYVGGESDKWVDDALKEAVNKDMKVINLMDVLGEKVQEEEIVEGMQSEEEEAEEDEKEYDEHVWLSLKNAEIISREIADKLSEADAANSSDYKTNADAYIQKLDALDKEYQSAADSSAHKTLLFGDRFPFRYMTDDYGLKYYAAFVGCSAETEASFETIAFLAGKLDELKLPAVMTIEKSNAKIAKTIISNSKDKNQQILSLNSMQTTTSEDVSNGASYIDIMQKNLDVLKDALK